MKFIGIVFFLSWVSLVQAQESGDCKELLSGEYMDYFPAKALIQAEGKGQMTVGDFFRWANSERRPPNFPPNPHEVYRDAGWDSWAEFLRQEDLVGVSLWNGRAEFLRTEDLPVAPNVLKIEEISTRPFFRSYEHESLRRRRGSSRRPPMP